MTLSVNELATKLEKELGSKVSKGTDAENKAAIQAAVDTLKNEAKGKTVANVLDAYASSPFDFDKLASNSAIDKDSKSFLSTLEEARWASSRFLEQYDKDAVIS